MSDPESTTTVTASAHEDSTAGMETHGQNQDAKPVDIKEETEKLSNLTLQIWPPTQRTREAVIKRLVETLSSPSVLSKRYGAIPEEEGAAVAKSIEDEAFKVADASFSPGSDGIEILQLYSKEISKRMLDTVKARAGEAASPAAPSASAAVDSSAPPTGSAGGEEVSSSVEEEA
ncbi:hypothetical protein SLE2022_113360 [Rubroshorea leprosula]